MSALEKERTLTVPERLRLIGFKADWRAGRISVADICATLNTKRYEQLFEGRAVIDRPASPWAVLGFLNFIDGTPANAVFPLETRAQTAQRSREW